MIIFSAFCPHTPILVPSVGKENIEKIKNTADSYSYLEQQFCSAKPDTVIVVSPHGSIYDDAFSINMCDKYIGNFEDFGDFATKGEYLTDHLLIERIQRHMRDKKVSITLDTCEKLDHGTLIPLLLLSAKCPNVHVVPINTSGLDLKNHFEFGHELKELILDTNKRVAVIASGDLSHALSTDAPAGFSEYGEQLDKAVKELIIEKNITSLLKLDNDMLEGAHECGLRSLSILLGILKGMNYEPEILSYEAPFGVGYLTCNFKLK
jgi:AmmeMemoRadiSam system protein B